METLYYAKKNVKGNFEIARVTFEGTALVSYELVFSQEPIFTEDLFDTLDSAFTWVAEGNPYFVLEENCNE